jgi:hypothetical protein
VLPALLQPPAWIEGVAGTPLADWTPVNLFRRELHSDDGVLRYPLPNVVRLFAVFVHPGFLPLGVLLILFVRKSDLQGALQRATAAMLITYLLFVGSMPFQNDRVLLLAQPFAAFLLYPAFLRLWAKVVATTRYSTSVLVVVVALQAALFVRAMAPFIRNAGGGTGTRSGSGRQRHFPRIHARHGCGLFEPLSRNNGSPNCGMRPFRASNQGHCWW